MRHFILFVLALILSAGPALGQIEQGDREVQAAGTLVAVEGVTMLMLSGTYGYYYTDKFEFGGGPTITHMSAGGWDDTNLSLTAFARYNFTARDKLVPYVSGQWYQLDLSPEDPLGFFDYSFVQVGGGFKYFLNENLAYDISGNLGFSMGSGDVIFLLVAGFSAIL